MGERWYCRECFVGWRPDQTECWQCGCPFAITKRQGVEILMSPEE